VPGLSSSEARNVLAAALLNVFRGLAESGFRTFFSSYMGRLGYSLGEIGAVATLSNVLGAAASPAVGYLLEVYSSRLITALTGIVSAVSLAMLALSSDVASLTISYALFSLAVYFAQPARTVFLARTVEMGRLGTVVGITTFTFTASRAVGPVLGGYLVNAYGYSITFLVLALAATAGSAAFLVLSQEPKSGGRDRRPRLVEAYRNAVKPGKSLALTYLFTSIDRAAWNLWNPMLSAHLLRKGYDEVSIGALLSLSNVVEAVSTPIAGRLTDRFGSSMSLALSEATAAAAAISLASPSPQPVAVLSMVSIGLSLGFWVPGYNVYVAKVFENVGEAFASINAVRSLASVPSPYLGGLLYEAASPVAPFVASTAMLVAAAGIATTGLRDIEMRDKPQNQTPYRTLPH
jgi:MFS family permease